MSLFFSFCLQCYQCNRENNTDALQYCTLSSPGLGNNANVTCSSNETKCLISKIVLKSDTYNVSLFTRKCATDNQCSNPGCRGPDGNGEYHCKSCCSGQDLCNAGEGPVPTHPPATTAPKTTPAPTAAATAADTTTAAAQAQIRINGLYMFVAFLACFLVCKGIMA